MEKKWDTIIPADLKKDSLQVRHTRVYVPLVTNWLKTTMGLKLVLIISKTASVGYCAVKKKVKFRVCGSVHLQIFNKTTNQMHNQSYIYCFVA
jgi:hypothetical protein